MKKVIVFWIFFLFSAVLFSAEPMVKLYLQDGSTKEFKFSDVDSLSFNDKKNNYVLRIHYDDTLVAYYPTEIIGSIKFEKDSVSRDILNVYIFSYPKPYILSKIDSLIFYIDQWQPLTIGSQVWMLKNLNVDHYRNGDSIPEVRDSITWKELITGAWCYYNNSDSIGKIYGKLYIWYAVNDPRILAPAGWHVPNDAEWKELEMFLGITQVDVDKGGSRGTDEGGKLKEAGTSHWFSPNIGATNLTGFSALPGGWRSTNADFNFIGDYCSWWSTTEIKINSLPYPWYRVLSSYNSIILRGNFLADYGYSVRCIKDK